MDKELFYVYIQVLKLHKTIVYYRQDESNNYVIGIATTSKLSGISTVIRYTLGLGVFKSEGQ